MDKDIGKLIKKKREELGFSIRELAKKIDMSPVYLCNIENGKRNLPSDYKLLLIANVLLYATMFIIGVDSAHACGKGMG